MSSTKKSVDEIWKELNAAKPKPRQGVAGLAVGLHGLPGITTVVRTKPAVASAAAAPPTAASAADSSKEAPSTQPNLCDSPYVASAVGEDDSAAYLATIQRTINCLVDPDRGLRRNAATTLQTKLFAGDASTPRASPAQLQALLCGPLLRPLVSMLSDSVERCRAVALAVLLQGGSQLADVSPMLPELVPELARRFGALPVQEPAEEVRLQMTQLTALLLAAAPPAQLGRFAPDFAAVLCRALEDGFPDIKKAACTAIETAAARVPLTALEPEVEKLLTSLAPNLQHQHSRVRLAAIQALDALVSAGAPMALVEGTVASALRPVGHDRAQPVREAAFTALARWMGCPDGVLRSTGASIPAGAGASDGGSGATGCTAGAVAADAGASADGAPAAAPAGRPHSSGRAYVPSLLPLLIIGVTDPQPATADLALRLVEGVGDVWVAAGGASGSGGGATEGAGLRACGSGGPEAAGTGGDGEAAAEAEARAEEAATDDAGGLGVSRGGADDGRGAAAGSDAAEASESGAGEQDAAAAATMAARVAACGLTPPYHGRPGAGCRAMVRALLPRHLPPLVRQLGEWTVALRVAAARSLHTTLVMAEDGTAAHLRLLLPALCSAIADEEVEVASYVMACVHVVGAYVAPGDWLPRLLDSLSPLASMTPPSASSTAGKADGGDRTAAASSLSASQRTHMLVVLSGLLHAAGRAGWELPPALLTRLAAVLAEEQMLAAAAEHPGVRQQLQAATVNLLAWGGAACAAVALPLHVVLLQLYGSELVAGAAAAAAAAGGARGAPGCAALDAMSTLAAACGCGCDGDGAAVLASRHSGWLMAALFGDEAAADAVASAVHSVADADAAMPLPSPSLAWRPRAGDATWQGVLRAMLMTATPATLQELAPGLVSALRPIVGDKEREAPLRLALLQLLDGVLEDPQRGPALARGGGQALILDVLMPPLVWQAGKTAAAVRYAAVTALVTLLSKCRPDPSHVLAVVEAAAGTDGAGAPAGRAAAAAAGPSGSGGLLPLLFSALDEDWYTDMRLAACYVVEKLLELVGPQLSDGARRAIYPELHKRLDDAHNAVRVAACGTLRAFVASAGRSYCDTNSGYLVAGVVIHMDDGDAAVQEAACGVLLAAAAAKPAVTAAEVRKVRDRFRSKHYCDRVLAACAEARDARDVAAAAAAAPTPTAAGAEEAAGAS